MLVCVRCLRVSKRLGAFAPLRVTGRGFVPVCRSWTDCARRCPGRGAGGNEVWLAWLRLRVAATPTQPVLGAKGAA